MAKNRKTAPDFEGKMQTASYYLNRKTAQKPHEKSAKTAKPHEKIDENRKTARKNRRKPQNRKPLTPPPLKWEPL